MRGPRPRGRCAVCKQSVAIRVDGTPWPHNRSDNETGETLHYCAGVWKAAIQNGVESMKTSKQFRDKFEAVFDVGFRIASSRFSNEIIALSQSDEVGLRFSIDGLVNGPDIDISWDEIDEALEKGGGS